jgi:radical SAM superfamily enzyme YgiQ (UPF0313 family)
VKVAFVAMSGVRVRSAELRALGVTLPGFVERGRVIASLPSLGLLTLAGATPPDVEVAYFEQGDVTPERLRDERFTLVAISTFTAQAPEAYAFADACRALGLRTAIGGLHATVRPEEARAHADHVFAGEAEETWPEFLEDLRVRRPKAVYDARGRVFPLERSPRPRYDLLDPSRYNRLTVQTTRSCPHRCTFCASGVLLRGPYRKKPVELVQRDLAEVVRLWPSAFVELADDDTFVDKAWGLSLARGIQPFGVKWFTETDVTVADSEPLLDALPASGCRQLLIGFEALDPAEVAGLEDRAFKAPRVAGYADAVARIQARGVSVNGCFVLGADAHTPAVFARVAEFADAVGLAEVQVTVLTPFPGTPLRDRLAAEGRLLKEDDWASHTLFDVTFRPARMTVRELEEGLLEVFARLYAADRVRARRRAFHDQVKAGRRAARTRLPAA